MKRLFLILLAVLLLAGCSAKKAEETIPSETEPVVEVTEPVSIYLANSSVEQQTGGAVKVFVPEEANYIGLATMNGDVVLASNLTKLTLMDGETGEIGASIKVGEMISCDPADLTTSSEGLSYYRADGQELVFLNTSLQQERVVEIPDGISGRPYVSHSNQEIYYCKDKEIRALSMQTGIARLVKSQVCESIELVGSYLSGNMLACKVVDEQGKKSMLYMDSKTGKTLDDVHTLMDMQTGDTQYLVTRQEGILTQRIFGEVDGVPQTFNVEESLTAVFPLGGGYRWYMEEGALVIDYYDFTTGTHSAQVSMVGVGEPLSIVADNKYLWILAKENGMDTLYRWDVTKSATGNSHSYIAPLYTKENPDTQGLNQCRERADELEDKYKINLRINKAAVKVDGNYDMEYEYQVAALTKMMDELEAVLVKLPKTFIRSSLENGKIYISLVRSIAGNKPFVQFYEDGNAYIILAGTGDLEDSFLHGLAYIVDSHVLGNSRDYDTWTKLNPSDFKYDYHYYAYKSHADSKYVSGKTRVVVDTYGMTFPHEDRARMFVYAMTDGNKNVFSTTRMQNKLKRLCQGIREAYDYEKNGKTYTWEQYLNTSLK